MTREWTPNDDAYDALVRETRAALRAGELTHAEHLAREALAHDPQRAAAYNLLAVLRLRQGHQPEAVDLLRAGLEVEPDYEPAQRNLVEWTPFEVLLLSTASYVPTFVESRNRLLSQGSGCYLQE